MHPRERNKEICQQNARFWYQELLPVFQGDDHYSRALVALEYARLKEGRAVELLLAALEDTEAIVRGAAASALGQLRVRRALDQLTALRRDPDSSVRKCAAKALEDIKTVPRFAFEETHKFRQSNQSANKLPPVHSGNPQRDLALSPITEVVNNIAEFDLKMYQSMRLRSGTSPTRIEAKRLQMIDFLGLSSPDIPTIEVAARALRYEHGGIRRAAVDVLESIDDPQAIPILRDLLVDENEYQRIYAARALERKGKDYPIEIFAQVLEKGDFTLQEKAIGILVELDNPAGIPLLIIALQHQRIEVRERAGTALIALSRVDFGWDLTMWEQWWKQQGQQ
ncbi:MAG TPA: HEAT repeat domain-containing protein [Armatimonadota bacterium]|jgi:hypothetical protein